MECLVLIASTRKALFSGDTDHSLFVLRLMQGTRTIILQSHGMNDTDNYNEFCRLLFRFRAVVPLSDLVKEQGYEEWITLVADFTIKAFQSWKVRKKRERVGERANQPTNPCVCSGLLIQPLIYWAFGQEQSIR